MPIVRRRSRQQKGHQQATVSLTPLIDTALTLLVIFMVARNKNHQNQQESNDVKFSHNQLNFIIPQKMGQLCSENDA